MKSIIFLSIDGVLNTSYGTDNSLKTRGETHDGTEKPYFCPVASEHIGRLIEHYDTDIVLCSTWADDFKSVSDVNSFFKKRGLNWPVIGKTSGSIKKWMKSNGTPAKYVIITDDDTLLDLFPTQTVVTEDLSGFENRKLYRKAMNILKKDAIIEKEEKEEPEAKLF
jgi:hypothetical protein